MGPGCHNAGVVPPRRLALAVVTALVAALVAGCVGETSRNDDRVGPYSFRPDPREHTLGPPGGPDGALT
jgi:hypothetical protein